MSQTSQFAVEKGSKGHVANVNGGKYHAAGEERPDCSRYNNDLLKGC